MNVIKKIRERLSNYPHAKYDINADSITVFPPSENGFEVALFSHGGQLFSVHFHGWHEEFSNENDAIDCFAFGLSEDCRLREFSRGGRAYKWTVEYRENNQWIADSTTGLFFYPFWREKKERYLQNNLIPGE